MRNTIDLWSGQRKCILCLTDEDIRLMVDVYENKQRDPMEVINKKYVEFIRMCPSQESEKILWKKIKLKNLKNYIFK